MNLNERLIEIAGRSRRYASFFYYPKKEIAELGIVQTLLEAIGRDCEIREMRIFSEDPPDVIVVDKEDNKLGFEITELVDRNTLEQVAKGVLAVKTWDSEEVIRRVGEIIKKKDLKGFRGEPYARRALVIFTDEPDLAPTSHMQPLKESTFPATRHFDEAYFLFSFDPIVECYPFVRLRLSGMP